MQMRITRFLNDPRLRTAVGGLILSLTAAGCGNAQKSAVPLVPASGTVTIDGSPLAEAVVQFIPLGETRGQGGSALTDATGTYKALTPFGEAGLPAGEYRVVISKRDIPKGADGRPKVAVGANAEELAPGYSDKVKSTLKATVPSGGEATNNFALQTSKKPVKGPASRS